MSQLDPSALNSRRNLFFMFVAQIVLDVILVAMSKDLWAISRILVAIAVMYFVLQGQKWAKWFLVALFSFLIAALSALIVALSAKLSSILIFGSLVLIVLCAIIVIYLVRSQDLNRYFSYKRQASSS